jgi:hypothetical protein
MAYEFAAASSQYLSTASSPASGTPMTIASWVRPIQTTLTQAIVAVGVTSGVDRNQIGIAAGGAAQVAVQGGAAFSQVISGNALTVNVWQHLCGTFTNTSLRDLYQDGVNTATGTTTINTQSGATSLLIGARYNTSLGLYASSNIAEVGVWNAALTAAEIASLAKGMTCDKVRPQSLVFYAPLVRDLIDYKGGLTITNNNTATVANHPRVYA